MVARQKYSFYPSSKNGLWQEAAQGGDETLYGFGGKRIKPIGVITLSVSFGTPKNTHTEYITFDVVDMLYPYNAIIGRGLLNTFKAALHSAYLSLKVPGTFGVITIFNSQKEARNIEHSFASGTKMCISWEKTQLNHSSLRPSKKYQ
jgi:hypothetical protein